MMTFAEAKQREDYKYYGLDDMPFTAEELAEAFRSIEGARKFRAKYQDEDRYVACQLICGTMCIELNIWCLPPSYDCSTDIPAVFEEKWVMYQSTAHSHWEEYGEVEARHELPFDWNANDIDSML